MAQRYEEAPPQTLDAEHTYSAIIHLDGGDVSIRLLPELAPRTVNSFVFLAREGLYDGTTFHRVIADFIAQGGDPTGTGSGGPGYRVPDELSDRSFGPGAVGMANPGPDSNGSQFFITLDAASHLDGRFTLFGEVIAGIDIVRSLSPRSGDDPSAPPGDRINSIEVVAG